MIVPGLDRIDGTAVSPQLLNSDELWHEHTSEVLELFLEENALRPSDEHISMVEFCAPYANGSKTTRAMRRAQVSKEWSVDALACRLHLEELRRTRPSAKPEIQPDNTRRRRNKAESNIARSGTQQPMMLTPGIIFACGGAYPYEEANSSFRDAMNRFRITLESEGFYVTPDHACHVTLATIQKPNPDERLEKLIEIHEVEKALRESIDIQNELSKGPFTLTAENLDIPGNGETIILHFKDETGRVAALRKAVQKVLGDSALDMRIPTLTHSTLARVINSPSCTREAMLKRLQGVFDNVEIRINNVDLVLEDRFPYFFLFPEGATAHWELASPAPTKTGETREVEAGRRTFSIERYLGSIDNAKTAKLSIFVIAVSIMLVWLMDG